MSTFVPSKYHRPERKSPTSSMHTLAALRLNGLALFSIVPYRQFDEPHWYGSLFALAVGKSMPLKAQDHWLGDTTFLGVQRVRRMDERASKYGRT